MCRNFHLAVKKLDFRPVRLSAPATLLTVGRGNDKGSVVRRARVSIDRGRGLRPKIAGFGVEIECADAVGAMRAVKLHAALDALDFVGLH